MTNISRYMLLVCGLWLTSPAVAQLFGQTMAPLEVVLPAKEQRASRLTKVAVFDFSGNDGGSFSNALRDAISSARVRGEPSMTILDSGMLQPKDMSIPNIVSAGRQLGVDAIYYGSVDTVNWDSQRTTEQRNVCTKVRNKYFGSCEDGYLKKQNVSCDVITGSYQATVTVIAVPGGDTIYTRQIPKGRSFKYCQGDKGIAPEGSMLASAAKSDVLAEIVGDLVTRTETIQVALKKASKLKRSDSKMFKDGAKAAKAGRWDKACGRWGAMEEKYPEKVGLIYNLGLCAEYFGDFDRALELYQKADSLVIDDAAINAAIDRANNARSME